MNISNELKVALCLSDLEENINIYRDDVLTVLDYNYECKRARNEQGYPYGKIFSPNIQFTLRNVKKRALNEILSGMFENLTKTVSFIFNPVFDINGRMEQYESALIVEGFVTVIEDEYSNRKEEKEIIGQRILSLTYLIRTLKYHISDKTITLQNFA